VDYLEMDVTTPAPLTVSDPLTVARKWLGGHAKATMVAAVPDSAE
jgi:hypothetical protein